MKHTCLAVTANDSAIFCFAKYYITVHHSTTPRQIWDEGKQIKRRKVFLIAMYFVLRDTVQCSVSNCERGKKNGVTRATTMTKPLVIRTICSMSTFCGCECDLTCDFAFV